MKDYKYDDYKNYEDFLKHFEEETITVDENYENTDIAEEKYTEKKIMKYLRMIDTYRFL